MHSVCVYCGSNPGSNPAFLRAARELGAELARRDIRLVYGGAKIGMMGALADAVLASGGQAVGVIPDALVEHEVAHSGLTELHVVRSMHERKTLMAELSEGFIALPGGIGTFEELFEIWTWAHLGLHQKPIALLNVAGYYDHLAAFLKHAQSEGFLKAAPSRWLLHANAPIQALDAMASFEAPPTAPILARDET